MDRLTGMAAFVKTVECGSFAAAGKALGMTPQMTGRHVAELETRIGTRLLNRTTRRQSLTEAGHAFYERCRALLADAEAAEAQARSLADTPRGRLRITAPVTFGAFALPEAIARFLNRYPDVQIDLTPTDRFVDIVDEGYDAAIRLGALNDSTLVARALKPYRFVVCASPAYLAAAGAPETPHALIEHECLGFAYTSAPPASGWGFIENGQAWTAPIAPRLRANDMKALITAAVNGLGIALAPETAVRDALRDGSLVPLLTQYEPVARPMHIVMASSPTTLKLRYFVEEVVAAFGA
ncbi:LysR substrate-binding domain-containing protein [Paraburkholderia tropica]|uniref:LysR substrate-binding domain-containing protein n=2 Tax=Paraburkholderia TaxID=1822464 RepID=UPI003D279328